MRRTILPTRSRLYSRCSTWTQSRKPLVEWLQDELKLRYDVPRKIAAEWITSDQVLPLLDGLDEVRTDERDSCIDAINAFRQSHGFLPLVVTSRTAEYEAARTAVAPPHWRRRATTDTCPSERLPARRRPDRGTDLRLPRRRSIAVGTAGFSAHAERRHLGSRERAGTVGAGDGHHKRAAQPSAWRIHRGNAPAQERRMRLDAGANHELVGRTGRPDAEDRQHGVLSGAVAVGLGPEAAGTGFSSVLQGGLRANDWIDHRSIVRGLVLVAFLAVLVLMRPATVHIAVVVESFVAIVAAGLLGGFAIGLFSGIEARAARNGGTRRWRHNTLFLGLVGGLIAGLMGAAVGADAAAILFLLYLFAFGQGLSMDEHISCADTVRWSWGEARANLPGNFRRWLIGTVLAWLFVSLLYEADFLIEGSPDVSDDAEFQSMLSSSWMNILLHYVIPLVLLICWCALFLAILFLCFRFVRGGLAVREIETRSVPNQGIHRSATNALAFGLFGSLAPVLTGMIFCWLFRNFGLILAFVPIGMILGPVLGLRSGGNAGIRHLILRVGYRCAGLMPWSYAEFLDYCADRILLRKVGGGYAFIHRMLLEHFANR